MNAERLKALNDQQGRISMLEHELQVLMRSARPGFGSMATEAAQARAAKIIEQDLEEQLAAAKREFERA